MASPAADAVRYSGSEPLLFEDLAAEVSHAGAKRRLGNLRVVPGAGPTDPAALLDSGRRRRDFVAGRAADPMGLERPEPLRFEDLAAASLHTGAELYPCRLGVAAGT